jgi:hypothetical protein
MKDVRSREGECGRIINLCQVIAVFHFFQGMGEGLSYTLNVKLFNVTFYLMSKADL